MTRYLMAFGFIAALAASGCATDVYSDNGYYYAGANYDPDCDYYTPPWGYPADYCHYRVWNQPVFYSGVWFNGPIYYRSVRGTNWFWLNGDWRRDQWRGRRDNIDFNRAPNQYWRGDLRRGPGRARPAPPPTGNPRRPSARSVPMPEDR